MVIMSLLYNNSFSAAESCSRAQRVLAAFLKQPVNEIVCTLLSGGSEEGNLVQCTHTTTRYVIKFFSDQKCGTHEILFARHAWELGIAPRVYYADVAGSYMITEFVQGSSLIPLTANVPGIIKSVATSLWRLHHSSVQSAHKSDLFTRIYSKCTKLQCSGELKRLLARGEFYVKRIESPLRSFRVLPAPCHNDLNWGNIFVDNSQVTLIDWGDAALSDPYYDIAAFFVLNVIEPASEKLFFKAYDARLLEPQWQEYMLFCKQLVHFEFALNLLLGVQAGESTLLHTEYVATVDDINHYLEKLAAQKIQVSSLFLYEMALASINRMMEMIAFE